MQVLKKLRVQALLCAAALIVCVVAAHPYAETGMTDDWSYIRTAQVLAQTGHVIFNGWGAPLLGWQLLPAALLFKIVGFSFTAARLSTLVVAVPGTFLLQRAMVRCGLREWNASVATLMVMLSPLMLPAVTSYLTDVWCLFAMILCLYGCLRALQAASDRAAMAWICAAALANAVTGTSRQIAWLGVLVMVPCTLWLLRARRRVVVTGAVACLAGAAFVYAAMAWFARQPYILPESLWPSGLEQSLHRPSYYLRPALELPMLLLPVLIMFLPALRRSGRKAQVAFAAGCVGLAAIAAELRRADRLHKWLVPFITQHGSIFSRNGTYVMWPVRGLDPLSIPEPLRLLLSAAVLLGLMAWMASFAGGWRQAGPPSGEAEPISWQSLIVLLGPFALAYTALLMPRAVRNLLIDRYLLPLLMVAAVLLVRYYQERMRPKLPVLSLGLVVVFALYSVAAVHDSFAMYRAVLRAANEMRAAGVPRDRIDAGWEYNGWTQITEGGYVHQLGIRVPGGANIRGPWTDRVCPAVIAGWLPLLRQDYTLSFDPNDCGGPAKFPPVVYRRWLPPHAMTIYVVKDPVGAGVLTDYDNLP